MQPSRRQKFTFFFSILIATFTFFSCQKQLDFEDTQSGPNSNDTTTSPVDLTTKVKSSVSGFVTNESDIAVPGAVVTAGGVTVTTDVYGYFSIKNIDVVKTAAVVKVEYPGYFSGIKTYVGVQDKSAFFRIKLIKKTIQGSVSAIAGGDVTLSNGLKISFPGSAFVVALTNTTYSGTVNVAAQWLDPTSKDLSSTMPGNLSGIDASGKLKALETFGMTAVELTGASGEKLQLAPGKKATLTIPLPSNIQGSAPSSIPLWYFDESTGLWKEDGTATKIGTNYIGEVSHFSFWNCDFPLVCIYFSCTLLDQNGMPMAFTPVLMSEVNNSWNARWGYTDANGYVGGIVPGNSTLKMEVYPSYNCPSPTYTSTFNTTTSDIALGNLVIPNNTQGVAIVSGSVVDCNNLPIINADVVVYKDYQYYVYQTDSLGNYSFISSLCGNSSLINLIALDRTSLSIGSVITQNLVMGNNVIPRIQLCSNGGGNTSSTQFINYSIDTSNYTLTSPIDTFNCYSQGSMTVSGSQLPNWNNGIYFTFDTTNIGVGSNQTLLSAYLNNVNDSLFIRTPISVNITEYGIPGQFVSGNFTGTLNGLQRTYFINCSFRVRRW